MDSKRYRILYVQKPKTGGTATGLYELVRGLDKTLYEPVVLFYEPSFYSEQFQALGIKVLVLNEASTVNKSAPSKSDMTEGQNRHPWLKASHRALLASRLIIRVARLIKSEAIDLVHHNNNLPKDRYTVIAAWLAGVPQVCHIRTLAKLSSIERNLARSVNTFIYMSKAIERLYQDSGIPASKGKVVYDGFDAGTFEKIDRKQVAKLRAEFGLSDRDLVVSNVGRLDSWKGHDYFLEAMAEVIRSQPNAKALIVGEPESSPWNQIYYQKLQKMVLDLKLSNHVIFTGFRADIPRIMVASDVMVHSSSEPEPFGRVVVEGMLASCPVVATAAGGVLDSVEDRVTGLLVPTKDAKSMADAILQLLQDREKSKAMGQWAQKRAKEYFSVEQHLASVQQIYQDIFK